MRSARARSAQVGTTQKLVYCQKEVSGKDVPKKFARVATSSADLVRQSMPSVNVTAFFTYQVWIWITYQVWIWFFHVKIIFWNPPLTCHNVAFGRNLKILLVTEGYFWWKFHLKSVKIIGKALKLHFETLILSYNQSNIGNMHLDNGKGPPLWPSRQDTSRSGVDSKKWIQICT